MGERPDNVVAARANAWSPRGDKAEAALIRQRLDLAQARAEVSIKASCFCRRMDLAAA